MTSDFMMNLLFLFLAMFCSAALNMTEVIVDAQGVERSGQGMNVLCNNFCRMNVFGLTLTSFASMSSWKNFISGYSHTLPLDVSERVEIINNEWSETKKNFLFIDKNFRVTMACNLNRILFCMCWN